MLDNNEHYAMLIDCRGYHGKKSIEPQARGLAGGET